MEATGMESSRAGRRAPSWILWTLLLGAVVEVAWAWFLLGFLNEPSAVGRPRVALALLAGSSLGVAALAVAAAVALLRRARWAPRLALAASVFMILSVVGAIIGIPLVFGLLASRDSKLS